jgi:hypothetical protein
MVAPLAAAASTTCCTVNCWSSSRTIGSRLSAGTTCRPTAWAWTVHCLTVVVSVSVFAARSVAVVWVRVAASMSTTSAPCSDNFGGRERHVDAVHSIGGLEPDAAAAQARLWTWVVSTALPATCSSVADRVVVHKNSRSRDDGLRAVPVHR